MLDNVVHTLYQRHIDLNRQYLLDQVELLRKQWIEAAGDLSEVTLNLDMLFDDFKRIIIGPEQTL